jgi:hypothetical protein
MKRTLLSFLIALGFSALATPSAYSSTDGCPASWVVDTQNSGEIGIQELLNAKNKLGSDMALTIGTLQYTNFSGESGPVIEPKGGRLFYADLYLYGNTKVTQDYVVQVKNCPGSRTFTFNLGTLKERLKVNSILVDVNSKEWANAHQSLFSDFLKAGKFSECLASKRMRLLTPGYMQHQFVRDSLLIVNYNDFNPSYPGNENCGLRSGLVLLDKTPSCRYMSPISVTPDRIGISIKMGGKCNFAFAYIDRNGSSPVSVFETFIIDSNDWRTSLTCTKGASKKVVRGIIGYESKLKCPPGYRKK